jgi:Flp pilus assembly protein TadG
MTRLGHESGAVLVEFALTLPLLLLLIVGIFDFGRLFQEYSVVTNAAREGARMAVLPASYGIPDIEARVTAVLSAGGVTATPAITVTDGSLDPGAGAAPFSTKRVEVQVDHTFSYLVPFARAFGGGTFDRVPLRAVSEMRTEIAADSP